MRISEYMNDKKRINVTVKSSTGEIAFYVEYKPNAWTYRLNESIKELGLFEKLAVQFEAIVTAWELTDDEGKAIPITVEAMKDHLSLQLMVLINNAILQANREPDDSKND